MKEFGMKAGGVKPANVDDILAAVEDAVRRAYALGRSDAMKRVIELAQSDDPGLRAVALLGPAEPARREATPAFLPAPVEHAPVIEPAPVMEEAPADAAPVTHAELHERSEPAPPVSEQAAPQQPASPQPAAEEPAGHWPAPARASRREPPRSVGNFLADYFYPLGSKK